MSHPQRQEIISAQKRALKTIGIMSITALFTVVSLIYLSKRQNTTDAQNTKQANADTTILETFLPEHTFTFVKTAESKMPMLAQRVIVKRDDGALFSALAAWNERFYPGEKVMVQKLTYPTNLMNETWETEMLVATPLNPPPPNP